MDSESSDSGGNQRWSATIKVALQRLPNDKKKGDKSLDKALQAAKVDSRQYTLAELASSGLMDETPEGIEKHFKREVIHAVASGKNLAFIFQGPSGAGKSVTSKKLVHELDNIADIIAKDHTGVVVHICARCVMPNVQTTSKKIEGQVLFEKMIMQPGQAQYFLGIVNENAERMASQLNWRLTQSTPQNRHSSRVLIVYDFIISTHDGNESKYSNIQIVDCPGREDIVEAIPEESKALQAMVNALSNAVTKFLCSDSLDASEKHIIQELTGLVTEQTRLYLVTSMPSLEKPKNPKPNDMKAYEAKLRPVKLCLKNMVNVVVKKADNPDVAAAAASLVNTRQKFHYEFDTNDDEKNVRNHASWVKNYQSRMAEMTPRAPPTNRPLLSTALPKSTLKLYEGMPPLGSSIEPLIVRNLASSFDGDSQAPASSIDEDSRFGEMVSLSNYDDEESSTLTQSPNRDLRTAVNINHERGREQLFGLLENGKLSFSILQVMKGNNESFDCLKLEDKVTYFVCANGAIMEGNDENGDSSQRYKYCSEAIKQYVDEMFSPTTDEHATRKGLLDAFAEFRHLVEKLRNNKEFWKWANNAPGDCAPQVLYILLVLSMYLKDKDRYREVMNAVLSARVKGCSYLGNLCIDGEPEWQETARDNSNGGESEDSENQEDHLANLREGDSRSSAVSSDDAHSITEAVTSGEEDTFGDDIQPGEDSDYEVGSNTDGSEGGESNDHEAGSNADDNEDGESNNLDEEMVALLLEEYLIMTEESLTGQEHQIETVSTRIKLASLLRRFHSLETTLTEWSKSYVDLSRQPKKGSVYRSMLEIYIRLLRLKAFEASELRLKTFKASDYFLEDITAIRGFEDSHGRRRANDTAVKDLSKELVKNVNANKDYARNISIKTGTERKTYDERTLVALVRQLQEDWDDSDLRSLLYMHKVPLVELSSLARRLHKINDILTRVLRDNKLEDVPVTYFRDISELGDLVYPLSGEVHNKCMYRRDRHGRTSRYVLLSVDKEDPSCDPGVLEFFLLLGQSYLRDLSPLSACSIPVHSFGEVQIGGPHASRLFREGRKVLFLEEPEGQSMKLMREVNRETLLQTVKSMAMLCTFFDAEFRDIKLDNFVNFGVAGLTVTTIADWGDVIAGGMPASPSNCPVRTPGYVAPETLLAPYNYPLTRGEGMFQLAVTFLETIMGVHPYTAIRETALEVTESVKNEVKRFVSHLVDIIWAGSKYRHIGEGITPKALQHELAKDLLCWLILTYDDEMKMISHIKKEFDVGFLYSYFEEGGPLNRCCQQYSLKAILSESRHGTPFKHPIFGNSIAIEAILLCMHIKPVVRMRPMEFYAVMKENWASN